MRHTITIETESAAQRMRRGVRDDRVAAMRGGVRLRAVTIPSGRQYRRRTKHRGQGWD